MCLHKLFDKHLGKEKLGEKSIFVFFTGKMKTVFRLEKYLHLFSLFLNWLDIKSIARKC